MRCNTHFTDEETKVQKGLRLPKFTQRRWSRKPCSAHSWRCLGFSPALPDEARGRVQGRCPCSCPDPRGGVCRAVAHSGALQLAHRTAPHLPRVPAAPPRGSAWSSARSRDPHAPSSTLSAARAPPLARSRRSTSAKAADAAARHCGEREAALVKTWARGSAFPFP